MSEVVGEVALDEFLRAEGFTTAAARAEARAVLESGGLTNPRKRAMASAKVARARAALDARLVRVRGGTAARRGWHPRGVRRDARHARRRTRGALRGRHPEASEAHRCRTRLR